MIKKLTLLAMAVGALVAFAVPAAASANVQLTNSGGKPIAANTTITATSTNAQTATSNGTLTCESVTVGAILTKNTPETVLLSDDEGSGSATGCKVKETSLPVTITPTFEELHLTTAGATASFSFVAHLGGVGGPKCTYTGVAVPVTYTPGTSSISVSGTLTGSGVAPCSATAAFTGTFALSATGGVVLM